MAKKKKKKAALSPSMFKVTGSNAKLKVDSKKKKLYYFGTKIKPEKAAKVAGKFGAEAIFETSIDKIKVGKPKLKYEFFYSFDYKLSVKYLKVDKEEIVIPEHVSGAFLGKEIFTPKKKDGFNKIIVPMVELIEYDSSTDIGPLSSKGGVAGTIIEKVLRGPGKKKATTAWIRKNTIAPGLFNSLEKVLKNRIKYAKPKPEGAKRVVHQSLVFKELTGYYVPTYFATVSMGQTSHTVKVEAVKGKPSLSV